MKKVATIIIGAGIGVVAIAAVPFTGGGSLFGAATLAASLAGTGTAAAAGAAAVGGGVAGAVLGGLKEKHDKQVAKTHRKEGFKDGEMHGRATTVEELKVIYDFFLASVALGYYVAKCDGEEIALQEELELFADFDALLKNDGIPKEIKSEVSMLMTKTLLFNDVKNYLDKVNISNLLQLQNDILEIVEADDIVSEQEKIILEEYNNYLMERKSNEQNEGACKIEGGEE